jgi:site-specific DNA recombinase
VLACGGCNSGMTATSTRRRGKLYRYYTPNNHIKKSCADCPIGSISAGEIEGIVLQQLQPVLKTPETLALLTSEARKTNPAATEADVSRALGNLAEIWEHVFPAEQERLMQRLIKRITVHPNRVDIDIQPDGVTALVSILPITAENKEAA